MYRFPLDFGPLHWALQRNREIGRSINEFSLERVCGEEELCVPVGMGPAGNGEKSTSESDGAGVCVPGTTLAPFSEEVK